MKKIRSGKPFKTETGETINGLEIAYHTWGTLNAEKDNVIWVCHALTANSDVESWWPGMVGAGRLLDDSRYYIVCANILGSCYGTTGPAEINPDNGRQWLTDFPLITIRDLVNVHEILRRHLGIRQIHTVIGASIGGYQALEYSIMYPEVINRLVFIASGVRQSPWAAAFNESQRLAMDADESFVSRDPEGGKKGLKAARAVALLSYRSANAYNIMQEEQDDNRISDLRASSYQAYQGEKLVNRFNPYSYHLLTRLSDTHNVGRGRNGTGEALKKILAETLVVAIKSDLLFPVDELRKLSDNVEGSTFIEIDSLYGHDGFLIETDQITSLVRDFWNKNRGREYDRRRA